MAEQLRIKIEVILYRGVEEEAWSFTSSCHKFSHGRKAIAASNSRPEQAISESLHLHPVLYVYSSSAEEIGASLTKLLS